MKWLCCIAFLGLLGCGSNDGLLEVFPENETAEDIANQSRFSQLIKAGSASILVAIPKRESVSALAQYSQNGFVSTWVSSNNISLSFQQGVLLNTRGLGWDLISADVAETLALLRANQSGTAVRIHRYLDGEDQIIARSFICDLKSRGSRLIDVASQNVSTRLIQERCQGTDISFQNLYWISQNTGEILQSRQWAGPEIGSLALRVNQL